MSKSQKAITHGYKISLRHPGLWLFAFLAAVGGIVNISFFLVNESVNIFLLDVWFSYRGLLILYRVLAIVIGMLLAFLFMIFASSFGKPVIMHVAAMEYYKEEEPWYGSLKTSLKTFSSNFGISLSFYIFSICFLLFDYWVLTLVIGAFPNSLFAFWFWLPVCSILGLAALAALGIITIYACGFASIFKLNYGKSMLSALDLFLRKPWESMGFLAKIFFIYAAVLAVILGAILLLLSAIFGIGRNASSVIHLLSGHGLIFVILMVILSIAVILLTSFSYAAWAHFFLDSVGEIKIPRRAAREKEDVEMETAAQGTGI